MGESVLRNEAQSHQKIIVNIVIYISNIVIIFQPNKYYGSVLHDN